MKGCGKLTFGEDRLEYFCGEDCGDGKIRYCSTCLQIPGSEVNEMRGSL